jgi:hypothetical protein
MAVPRRISEEEELKPYQVELLKLQRYLEDENRRMHDSFNAVQQRAEAAEAALEPFANRAEVVAPVRIQPPVERWEAVNDGCTLRGRWAEDGSPYDIRLPHQLIPALQALQELAGACKQARAALAGREGK